jgi:hypothetical protein
MSEKGGSERADVGRRPGWQRLAAAHRTAGNRMVGVAMLLIVALALTPAIAQPRYIRLTGWVQWIAGEKLMLIRANGGGGVPVDLADVPLDEYRTLTQRDYIVVTGVVSQDNRGLAGVSIRRIPDWYSWEQQGP